MRHLATWVMMTTGSIICMTQSRALTGLVIRMPLSICAAMPFHLSSSLNIMGAVLTHRRRQDLPAPFGGHTLEHGKAMARRGCAAADRTGHAILHTLYQQCLKYKAEFFIEYFALDLLMDDEGRCCGVLALCMEDGTLHRFRAQKTVLAQEGMDVSTSHVLLHIHVQVMVTRWFYVLVCLCRIWSLSSSIQQVFMEQVY